MTDYTPTTERVKIAYVKYYRDTFIASTGELEQEFERWFSEVQADAWDEGATVVLHAEGIENTKNALENLAEVGSENPYRRTE